MASNVLLVGDSSAFPKSSDGRIRREIITFSALIRDGFWRARIGGGKAVPEEAILVRAVSASPELGGRRSETSRTSMAGVTTAENPCPRGREGGIQAQGRGWTPSIWEISGNIRRDRHGVE
jgi:hypothetical protein